MSDIAHTLARRAVDVTQQHYTNVNGDSQEKHVTIAVWAIVLVWATVLIYMALVSMVSYTYGDVVTTLAMIETPTATAFDTDPKTVDAKDPHQASMLDSEILVVKNPLVTRKLRTATKHLVATAGRFARFRGLQVAIVYHFLHSLILNMVAPGRGSIFRPVVSIATSVILCRIQMTWTHVVISMPSHKSWWRRMPSMKASKNILLPTAIWAFAQQVCMYVPAMLFGTAFGNLRNAHLYSGDSNSNQKIALVQLLAIVVVFIGTIILILIPAEVTLKRVQASMLAEEEESIVSFDRTFDGKFKPEILGGSGSVSMLDAWRTFGKEARLRLLKLYGKVFATQIALAIMFTMVLIGEVKLIAGGDFDKLVETARKSFQGEL